MRATRTARTASTISECWWRISFASAGDRYFAEDMAIIGGVGRFRGRSVVIIGHEKGSDTETRLKHNFGMARPEGYRKTVRLMKLAEKFGMPIITFVDTAGAYPGIGAEERGQAEAIARSIDGCLAVTVPIIAIVIGEGGSGGAVAIATANKVLMLEHSIYTVASPEAAASILWRDSARAQDAATNMKITAQDLSQMGIIDHIISEPVAVPTATRPRSCGSPETCWSGLCASLTACLGRKFAGRGTTNSLPWAGCNRLKGQ